MTALDGFVDDRTGRPRALVTSYAGARVVLDLLDGGLVGAVDERAHARASATTRIDGEQLIVSGAGAGYLQVSDLDSGRSRWRQWCGDVRSLATVTLAGRPIAVLTGGSPHVEIWSLGADRGTRLHTLRTGGERISVLAATEVGEAVVLAVGTSAGRVSLWRLDLVPGTGDDLRVESLGEHGFEVSGLVTVLGFADWQGRRILLGAAGRVAQSWDVRDGRPLGPPFTGHTGQVNSVLAGRLGDRAVLWSGDDATVRAWLPESGRQLGEAFRYPYEAAPTRTIAVEISGRPMLVTGDGAGLVWVWDPEQPYPFRPDPPAAEPPSANPPPAGLPAADPGSADLRSAELRSADPGSAELRSDDLPEGRDLGDLAGYRLAVAGVAGRSVLLAELPGEQVRGFDPVTGEEVGLPLDGIPAGATLVPGEHPVLAGPGPDRLELWDPQTGARIATVPAGDAGPAGTVRSGAGAVGPAASGLVYGRRVLLLAAGAALFLLDVASGRLDGPVTAHSGRIRAVAIGELAGIPVGLTAADDDTVRLWELDAWGSPGRTVLDGHGGVAYAVATATVDGRGLVFAAGRNGQVRCVDLTDLVRSARPAAPAIDEVAPEPAVVLTATRPVRSLAVVPADPVNWLVAVDGSVLRWHPLDGVGIPGQVVELTAPVTALVALPELLVVATGDGLLGYRPPPARL
ncbi:WD40 repeat domain-containing protein [Plantactinospora endophytica]|uniref:WD40 repeat domain-containing protein n=1 Tax=Plantactinospora endophytica TaxID=673535 RepID=UPI001940EC7C|nr:WD40 repeat domain-containing protein [Plantactinospora endophytica]